MIVCKDAVRDQPLYAKLWGNSFLPSQHQGIQFRSGKDTVLYLGNPENYDGSDRRQMLDYPPSGCSQIVRLSVVCLPHYPAQG